MDSFELVTLKSGTMSLRSVGHGETFHPVVGPKSEAEILHVRQQRLQERARTHSRFVIWDVGLGAAANATAAIEALHDCETSVEIHSFDQTLTPLDFAIRHAKELTYLQGHEKDLERLREQGVTQPTERISWTLHLADFRASLGSPGLPAPHAILYDPYSPSTNPEMWTLEHFRRLRNRLESEHPCLLTNYTRSTSVRVTLLLAGFHVGIGEGVGEKDQTTIASNRLEWLERPLGAAWLERVQRSRNAAPLRDEAYSMSPILPGDLEALKALPQFRG